MSIYKLVFSKHLELSCKAELTVEEQALKKSLEYRLEARHKRLAVEPIAGFSQMESAIARGIHAGMRSTDLAQELLIAEQTLGTHRQSVYNKLGVHNQVQLALWVERGVRPEQIDEAQLPGHFVW